MENKKDIVTTIQASDVEVNTQALKTESSDVGVKKLINGKIESSSIKASQILFLDEGVAATHNFLLMLEIAFNNHKSITISPDHIWLLICQGFAQGIKVRSEELRNQITTVKDKQIISVRRDDFKTGEENPWEEIIPEFSKQISTYLKGDLYSVVVQEFSTTTLIEKTAFEIAFMDSMSNYFEYMFISACGIPSISIKGEKEDYQKIINGLSSIAKYGFEWWTNELIPIVQEIINAISGDVDRNFWTSLYKQDDMSGGPYISGWITKFFPYVKKVIYDRGENSQAQIDNLCMEISHTQLRPDLSYTTGLIKNPHLENGREGLLKLDNFPSGMTTVPFKWQYVDKQYDMSFASGFIGIKEEIVGNCLNAQINWIVVSD